MERLAILLDICGPSMATRTARTRSCARRCVFVEFDDVDLSKDEHGVPRSFFPDDPKRRRWIPIFRQRVSSTVEEKVQRENYPLQLAWAMTFHKAASPQGPAHFDDGRPTPNSDCKIRVFAGRDPGLFLKTMPV